MNAIIPQETIEKKILVVRGKKVMLDRDLAVLYGVETRVLNQAVSRNEARFPEDFMFKFTAAEFRNWKSQIVISNSDKMGLRKAPHAFTELGVAMLSSVLNSRRAVMVNIQIMRTFVRLRELISQDNELRKAVQGIEKRLDKHDREIQFAFTLIQSMLKPPPALPSSKPNRKMGFA